MRSATTPIAMALTALALGACDGLGGGEATLSGVVVEGDPNQDGLLSPGETANLVMRIKNAGSGDLKDVRYVLVSHSDAVTITGQAEITCGQINSGVIRDCPSFPSSAPKVEVAASAEVGSVAPFTLTVNSQSDSWTLPFELPIELPDATPEIETLTLFDDSKDGWPSPGEPVSVLLTLVNAGPTVIKDARLRVVSQDEALMPVTDNEELYCGQLNPGIARECGHESNAARIEVAPDAAVGEVVDFKVFVTAEGGLQWILAFQLQVLASGADPVLNGVAVDDDSGDSKLSPGERAYLQFSYTNGGSGHLVSGEGSLSAPADIAIASNETWRWGSSRVYPDKSADVPVDAKRPEIRAAEDAAPGPRTLEVTTWDAYGGLWTHEVTIDVVP